MEKRKEEGTMTRTKNKNEELREKLIKLGEEGFDVDHVFYGLLAAFPDKVSDFCPLQIKEYSFRRRKNFIKLHVLADYFHPTNFCLNEYNLTFTFRIYKED